MTVQLNHIIVWCRDNRASSTFLVEILGLPKPTPFGPFEVVEMDNGVSLDFHAVEGEIASQHYAFLMGRTISTRSSAGFASATSNIGPIPD